MHVGRVFHNRVYQFHAAKIQRDTDKSCQDALFLTKSAFFVYMSADIYPAGGYGRSAMEEFYLPARV